MIMREGEDYGSQRSFSTKEELDKVTKDYVYCTNCVYIGNPVPQCKCTDGVPYKIDPVYGVSPDGYFSCYDEERNKNFKCKYFKPKKPTKE
jgi:hypothetical protein